MGRVKVKTETKAVKKVKVINEEYWIDALRVATGRGQSGGGHVRPLVDFTRDSLIFLFEGWRGSGKTTAITYWAALLNWQLGLRLIGNYPLNYDLQLKDGSKRRVSMEELDFQKILTFNPEYTNALLVIDEAPDVVSHMASMSVKSRLVNIFVRELRKNGNSLFLGAQHFELIDKSLRWQVDIIVGCQDASRKFQNYKMERGSCILLDFYDNSGMITGQGYQSYGYGDIRIPGKNSFLQLKLLPSVLWGDEDTESVYDTLYQQDILQSLRKATLKLESYEITDGVGEPKDSEYLATAANVIKSIISAENKAIYNNNFYKAVGALSGKEKLTLSRLMSYCDVKKGQDNTGHYYDFSAFDLERFLSSVKGVVV